MPQNNPAYSPFWGLQILVVALGVWISFQIVGLTAQETEAKEALHRILPDAEQADTMKKQLFSLVEDLTRTSATDPAAGQILKDFNVQVQKRDTGK